MLSIITILEIISNLKELASIRTTYNRSLFINHIEPIYINMKDIYCNYNDNFLKLEFNIKIKNIALFKISKELSKQREKFALERQELLSYSAALTEKSSTPDIVKSFCSNCNSVIIATPENIEMQELLHSTQLSSIITVIDNWKNRDFRKSWDGDICEVYGEVYGENAEAKFRYYLADTISKRRNIIQSNWKNVMNDYFKLKVKYLREV